MHEDFFTSYLAHSVLISYSELFQEFHLETMERANKNADTSSVISTEFRHQVWIILNVNDHDHMLTAWLKPPFHFTEAEV